MISRTKKIFITVLSLVAICCALAGTVALAASAPATKIKISQSSVVISVDGQKYLAAVTENTDSAITWTSADTSIATVVDGTVTGKAVGKTTVTATVDGKSASCAVTVVGSSYFPVLELSCEKAEIGAGSSFDVVATVTRNNEAVSGANITWESSDTSVVTVSNGKITGIKASDEPVIVTVKVTGLVELNGEALVKQISVKVRGNKALSVNQDNVELYVKALNDGENESAVLTFTATEGTTVKKDASVTWTSSDTSIATVNADGKVTAKGAGTTDIIATYTDGGDVITAKASVTVKKATEAQIYNLGDIDMSKTYYHVSAADIGMSGYTGAIEVTQEGNDNSISATYDSSADKYKIRAAKLVCGETTLTFELSDRFVKAEAICATKILTSVSDIKKIANLCGVDANNTYSGYLILGNSIDMGGEVVNGPAQTTPSNRDFSRKLSTGFNGTFDGRGYVISNAYFKGFGGLFGIVGSKGVVKNLAIADATLEATDTLGAGCIAQMFFGTLQDCFISFTLKGIYAAHGGVAYVSNSATLNNVVIQAVNKSSRPSTPGAAVIEWLDQNNTTFNNVYSISDDLSAYNNGTPVIAGSGLTSYKPGDNMTFNGLNEEIWLVSDGVARFKSQCTYKTEYYLEGDDGNYTLDSTTTVVGTLGASVSVVNKSYAGYSTFYDESQPNVLNGTVSQETLTLKIYYPKYDVITLLDATDSHNGITFEAYDKTSAMYSGFGGAGSQLGTYYGQTGYKISSQANEWYNRLQLLTNTGTGLWGANVPSILAAEGYKTLTFDILLESDSVLYLTENRIDANGANVGENLRFVSKDTKATEIPAWAKIVKKADSSAVSSGDKLATEAWYTVTVDVTNLQATNNDLLICAAVGSVYYISNAALSKTAFGA